MRPSLKPSYSLSSQRRPPQAQESQEQNYAGPSSGLTKRAGLLVPRLVRRGLSLNAASAVPAATAAEADVYQRQASPLTARQKSALDAAFGPPVDPISYANTGKQTTALTGGDADKHQAFEQAMAQFDRRVAHPLLGSQGRRDACRDALRLTTAHQSYLRSRQAQVGSQLQEHKERYEALLGVLCPPYDQTTWSVINGVETLMAAAHTSPFDAARINAFLKERKDRQLQLELTIARIKNDIKHTYDAAVDQSRMRAIFNQQAHNELVEHRLIELYLQMTEVTRHQLATIRARSRLETYADQLG